MLSFFRRAAASPVGIAIFSLLLIAMVVTLYEGRSGLGLPGMGGGGVATVGGEDIPEGELVRRVQNELEGERQRQPAIDMPAYVAAGGVERTIELVMNGRAMEVFAQNQGMVASKRLVDGAIASIPAFNGPTGSFDRSTFLNVLANRKLTETQVRTDFAREALTRSLLVPAAGNARVPATLVEPYAALQLEARSGQVAAVPSAAFAAGPPPSDVEVQAFYRRAIARYTVPERRVIRYALFDKSRFADQSRATDAEIAAAYSGNPAVYGPKEKRSFTQIIVPTQAQANALLEKIRGGMPIADAARTIGREALDVPESDPAAFAKLTGPTVARAAFAARQGDYAAVERSGLGWHIVHVDSVKAIPASPLASVKTTLAASIATQKQLRAVADFTGKIEDAIAAHATPDDLAKRFALTFTTTPPLTGEGRAFEATPYTTPPELAPILRDAFQAEIDDDPILTPLPGNAGYVVWKLDRTVPSAPKPLAALRPQVVADVMLDRGSKAAKAAADAIVAAVNGGTPLAQAMAKVGVKLPPPAPANARRIDLARQQQVPPPLALMFALPERRARVLQMPDKQGWFVVYLDRIVRGDLRSAPGLVDATREKIARVVGDEYVQQFARAVQLNVGASKNAAAVARLKATLTGGGAARP